MGVIQCPGPQSLTENKSNSHLLRQREDSTLSCAETGVRAPDPMNISGEPEALSEDANLYPLLGTLPGFTSQALPLPAVPSALLCLGYL